MNDRIATAAGLGAVTGLRGMQGLAWVSRELAGRRARSPRLARLAGRARRSARGPLERWLTHPAAATVLAGLAAGELMADKLPGIPGRIAAPPLLGRAAAGGLLGAVAVAREERVLGAAVGAGAAVIASFAGWYYRTRLAGATRLPDAVLAMTEDAVAILGARALADRV